VFIGVIVEEADEFFDWMLSSRRFARFVPVTVIVDSRRFKKWAKRISRIGWFILIAGVLGEGLFEVLVSHQDTKLQSANSARLEAAAAEIKALQGASARALDDAKSATEKAKTASDVADAAKVESGKARDAAGQAESLARRVSKEADAFETRISTAESKEKKLEERLGWRVVTRKQHDSAVSLLSPYAASRVIVNIEGDGGPEITAFSTGIITIFHDSHWIYSIGQSGTRYPPEIGLVCVIDETSAAGKALVKALSDLPGAEITTEHVTEGVGVITIGSRPL
jgi:hypothetical protein